MTIMSKLRGSLVVLREKSLEDAWNDYLWRSDEELAALDAAPPFRLSFPEYSRLFTEELQSPVPGSERLAIETLDGKHIGNCMYYDIDERKKQAELGIMIGDREYWNQGYGLDVVSTLLDYIFTSTGLERVYLHTLDWNHRAQRCFQKCGFTPIKTVRRGGKKFILMDIYRGQWQEMRRREGAEAGTSPGAPEGAA